MRACQALLDSEVDVNSMKTFRRARPGTKKKGVLRETCLRRLLQLRADFSTLHKHAILQENCMHTPVSGRLGHGMDRN